MRLIDADALRERHGMGEECSSCVMDTKACRYGRDYSKMDFCEWLDDAPTIDAVPVRHGEWIFKKPPDDWVLSLYECSVCHHMEEGQPNYCPNCGAKMKGENDEQIH